MHKGLLSAARTHWGFSPLLRRMSWCPSLWARFSQQNTEHCSHPLPAYLPPPLVQEAQRDCLGLGMPHDVWAAAPPLGISICPLEKNQK